MREPDLAQKTGKKNQGFSHPSANAAGKKSPETTFLGTNSRDSFTVTSCVRAVKLEFGGTRFRQSAATLLQKMPLAFYFRVEQPHAIKYNATYILFGIRRIAGVSTHLTCLLHAAVLCAPTRCCLFSKRAYDRDETGERRNRCEVRSEFVNERNGLLNAIRVTDETV